MLCPCLLAIISSAHCRVQKRSPRGIPTDSRVGHNVTNKLKMSRNVRHGIPRPGCPGPGYKSADRALPERSHEEWQPHRQLDVFDSFLRVSAGAGGAGSTPDPAENRRFLKSGQPRRPGEPCKQGFPGPRGRPAARTSVRCSLSQHISSHVERRKRRMLRHGMSHVGTRGWHTSLDAN